MTKAIFTPGSRKLVPPADMPQLAEMVKTADPQFWNGATGVSSMSWDSGGSSVYLYISLAPDESWHIRYQFADNSFVIAHDSKRKADETISLWIGGNESRIPSDQFVDSALALSIMQQFMRNGHPFEMADWRVPGA